MNMKVPFIMSLFVAMIGKLFFRPMLTESVLFASSLKVSNDIAYDR